MLAIAMQYNDDLDDDHIWDFSKKLKNYAWIIK